MSVKALNWAFQQQLKPNLKALLVAIADNCNDEGLAWPSQRYLAEKTCLSPSSIKRNLNELLEQGYITVQPRHRENGSQRSNNYYLNMEPKGGGQNELGRGSPADPLEPPYIYKNKREPNLEIPDDFQMSEKTLAWFAQHHPDLDTDALTRKFITSCQAKGTKYKRPQMAIRDWGENEAKWSKERKANAKARSGKLNSPDDIADTIERARNLVYGTGGTS